MEYIGHTIKMLELGPTRFASPDGGAPQLPKREIIIDSGVGINDENDRLTRAAVWGPVGAEAVLAQIYPSGISLFYDQMNVQVARLEAENFAEVLTSHGVRIHTMRDVLAQEVIPEHMVEGAKGITRDNLADELLDKAAMTYRRFYYSDGKSRLDGQYPAGGTKRLHDYTGPIIELIDQDIERYGLERAIALNEYLSVDPHLPMGNAMFARDQMNVLLGTRFISSMARPIRQPEVPMYEALYRHLGFPPGTELPHGETFEGGDAYVHNGIVYVGVGTRTTRGAAHFIFSSLKPQLDELGFKFAIIEDVAIAQKSPDELQQFMHLDTFSNPTGTTEMVVCDLEAKNRRVKTVSMDNSGRIIENDEGTFIDFLDERNDVTHVAPSAQAEFACNFLAIDRNTVLVADTGSSESKEVAAQIEGTGRTVVPIPLYESTRGFGATHCMTGQLRRVT